MSFKLPRNGVLVTIFLPLKDFVILTAWLSPIPPIYIVESSFEFLGFPTPVFRQISFLIERLLLNYPITPKFDDFQGGFLVRLKPFPVPYRLVVLSARMTWKLFPFVVKGVLY